MGSKGLQLTDLAALKKAGAVAITDDGKPILGDDVMRTALLGAGKLGIPIIQHAEDTLVTAGASMNAGATAFRLGLRGWPAQADASIVKRYILLTAVTKATYHAAHLPTSTAP